MYDLGDVLFEAHYWREWNFHELVALGYFSGNFAEFYDVYDSFLERIYRCDPKETYERTFDKFLHHIGFADNGTFTERSLKKKKEFEDTRTLYDGVKETLLYFHERGIKNVIITDNESNEEAIRNTIISKYSINQCIDHIVTSRDVGATKPDPKIFLCALHQLAMKGSDVLFVGHDRDELEGAAKIGLVTVEFNNYLGRNIHTDYKIAHITELQKII
jgi:HAD superfamily hydrolase (TIGR01549 family)